MRRFVATLLTAAAIVAPLALPASAATAPKAGQLCKAADVGKTKSGVTCTKDGTRYRWAAGKTATTKAPATTKPAKTATTKAVKAATPTTTAAKATTNSKATGTTKKPSAPASAGGGNAVKGRFCAKADKGRKATDSKGRKLTCKADAAGKNRWQE